MKAEILYKLCVGTLVLVFVAMLLNCFMVKDYGMGTLVCFGFLVGYRLFDKKTVLHEEQQIVEELKQRDTSKRH
ncbi:hypothetical protein GCM10023189_41560 [Nibrella saemangeumensis]|uniref:Uncharacterized protein n=1 Tax=Nibrella saemangeumensis TaxID=1084526 RepID=A0ABP8N9B6_9BACT